MSRLYHFTHSQNALGILTDGAIVSSIAKEAAGKGGRLPTKVEWDDRVDSLVWLTSNRAARQAWMVDAERARQSATLFPDFKWQVRFEVEVDAEPWVEHAERTGFPEWYVNLLAYEGTQPETWFVTEAPVPIEQVVSVTLTEGERRLWTPRHDRDRAIEGLAVIAKRMQEDFYREVMGVSA